MEQGAQSIYRAVAVLKELATRNGAGSGMTEIAEATGLTGPTVHRILRAFVDVGFAYQRAADKRYFLGPFVHELGLSLSHRLDLEAVARAATDRLAELTGDTAFFLRRVGVNMLCVSRTSGSFPVKTLLTDVGTRRLLGLGAGGLAVLAALPRAEAMDILAANERSYAEAGRPLAALAAEMDEAAQIGHVVRRLGDLGATTVAIAVLDGQKRPIAALSMSAISQRMREAHLDQAIAHLKQLRHQTEAQIAFAVPNLS
ncbi:DNA-binding IclR family transcriptional regulator [Angulomicrobium tetraedrale]|uniref:DNA-binding IclR family transcriptional regulator n=1 Tax=Ancylobacter tetraedralis TaxID=217068 RepID=A0A839ZDE5_9HYPH|nr:helix-turn-helix domain-containing protein [Ancylobacter tetraedralis]MBB3772764.1 DNA-binding IclR family transcriptional regulator [Ancylobacter tetraedralis]